MGACTRPPEYIRVVPTDWRGSEAARDYEDELARYRSPRDWWRIAALPDGEPAGFAAPALNDCNHVFGYLAVLPEHFDARST